MKKKKNKLNPDNKVVCRNKKAYHLYHIEDSMEVGIILRGTEIKSIRQGKVSITDGYASFENGELFVKNLHISPYEKANNFNHEPLRARKLLLHKKDLKKLQIKINERGYTLVPLEVYITKKGYAKVLLGLAKGRKQYDNRDQIRKKAERREMRQRD